MTWWRQGAAILLVLTGAVMLARGCSYALREGLGWQAMVQAGVVGLLVIGLGVARWRFWRQRSR